MKNALSVDLEDYYHATAFAASSTKENSYASRVEANTEKVLGLLSAAGCRATFFTVGWVAEHFPQLIRAIANLGHEIACHSYGHRLVYSLTPTEFREDTRRAKQFLEDACGARVRGYRAPTFSITPNCLWAFEILAELGFTYDSSIFPIKHLDHGMPDGPRFPFRIETRHGHIVEFPLPTLTFAGARSPFGGGAYLRLLPYRYTRWGIHYINGHENHAVCVYLHPWELDTEQPRMNGSLTARLRQYVGLKGMESKLKHLLRDFEFCPLGTMIEQLNAPDFDLLGLSKRS
ncbi:MAG TPA: XrtA system polysaccharide deacetylase [Candidatus Acidoferrum sp.]|nr:XrtA system polysaccharide deacetylase [Candidatus Acidoferrum sp.]